MTNLSAQAKAFFETYQSTFDSGDMKAFSRFFLEPFISARPDGHVQSMPTHGDAECFFSQVLRAWKAEGYASFRTRYLEVLPIGGRSMLVTLTWEMLDDGGAPLKAWRQSYNLLRHESEWRVMASTFHAP